MTINHLTVIPADKIIIANGEGLIFDFAAPAALRALQWHNGSGHVEFSDELTPNLIIQGQEDYEKYVRPYVQMWEEIDHNVTTTEQYSELTEEQQIKNRLSQIDLESVRPLRAKVSGTSTPEDDATLAALEQEAGALRVELAGLSDE